MTKDDFLKKLELNQLTRDEARDNFWKLYYC